MKYTKKPKKAITLGTSERQKWIAEMRKDPNWASIFDSLDKEVAIAKEYGHDLNQHWQEMLATLPPTKTDSKSKRE